MRKSKEIKRLFINFLKHQGVFVEFVVNLSIPSSCFFFQSLEFNKLTLNEYLNFTLRFKNQRNFIQSAFSFGQFKDQLDWYAIDKAWKKTYKDYCDGKVILIQYPKPSEPQYSEEVTAFISFLKENDAFIPFCRNLSIQKKITFFEYLKETSCLTHDRLRSFDLAFKWGLTPEDFQYWNQLDYKWWKILAESNH